MGQDVTKYTYRIRWSEEDGEYLATVAEFPSLSWLEENQAEAFEGIVNLVRDVVEDMEADGEKVPTPFSMREYSGSVRLRIPPEQHRELAVRAAEEGVSLNRLLCSLISRPAGITVGSAKSDLADTVAEDRAPTLRNGPTKSITILTEAPSSRSSLKLVEPGESTVKHATETGRLESSNGYGEWPEEMRVIMSNLFSTFQLQDIYLYEFHFDVAEAAPKGDANITVTVETSDTTSEEIGGELLVSTGMTVIATLVGQESADEKSMQL